MSALQYRWVTQIRFISANNAFSGKTLNLDSSMWLKRDKSFLLHSQDLKCLQLRIIHMPSGTLGVGVGCCPETLQCQGKEEVVVSSGGGVTKRFLGFQNCFLSSQMGTMVPISEASLLEGLLHQPQAFAELSSVKQFEYLTQRMNKWTKPHIGFVCVSQPLGSSVCFSENIMEWLERSHPI